MPFKPHVGVGAYRVSFPSIFVDDSNLEKNRTWRHITDGLDLREVIPAINTLYLRADYRFASENSKQREYAFVCNLIGIHIQPRDIR